MPVCASFPLTQSSQKPVSPGAASPRIVLTKYPEPSNQLPVHWPPVACSSAPATLVPVHVCAGSLSLLTDVVVVVRRVVGTSVRDAPSTRTVTAAGPAATAEPASAPATSRA